MTSRLNKIFGKKNDSSFKDFLKEFNRSISIIIDKDLLINNILSKIEYITKAENVHLFLLNPDANKYEFYTSSKYNPDVASIKLSSISDIIRWLLVNEKPLFLSKYLLSSEKEEKELFNNLHVKVLFPLNVLGKLNGVLLVCGNIKTEEEIKENIDLISITIDQAAMAFENALLYEQQKDRLKKMYRADQLSVLGQLAAGAAHEIRNPLTIIRSTIQFLKDEVQNKEMVSELIEEVDRINAIIQGLLNFAKPAELNVETISLETIITQSISLTRTTAKNKIDIKFINNCKNSDIHADASQLKQVFLNLLLNSIDAVSDKDNGFIDIILDIHGQNEKGVNFLVVKIKDNGCGISAENIEKLFIPFFTTKTNGTGLGLSICYGIINRHGGEIEIYSKENLGTTINIKLPQ
ncbi:MAG: histidine kinase [Bacteroidales bacterium]|nr:histidine kinase [Bacteroidales bacterium]